MTTILMLAFEFPPATSVGMQRSLKLARYLPQHGARTVVVTTDAASLGSWFERPLDSAPLSDMPAGVDIHRVPCPRPSIPGGLWARRLRRLLSLGDEDIGDRWEPRLVTMWDRVIADAKPDAIYVTIPPFSMAPLAARLARRSGLPLIVDFRDNWSQWCHSPHTTWLHYRLTLRRERACLEQAAAIVTTTSQIAHDLQAVHPHVDRSKFHVIASGYDAPALPALLKPTPPPGPFVIGYVGSFYYLPLLRASGMQPWWRRPLQHWLNYSPRREDWLYRTPYFFFAALRRLFDDHPSLRAAVKVRFAGDPQDWLDDQVRQFGLQDVVEHAGRLSHADSLAFQSRCDALLATSAKVIGGRDPYIAGKTFEYLAAGRPVVAFVTEGEQRDFWQQSGIAVMCDPDDPVASARALQTLVNGDFAPRQNRPFLEGCHARETARRLVAVAAGLR